MQYCSQFFKRSRASYASPLRKSSWTSSSDQSGAKPPLTSINGLFHCVHTRNLPIGSPGVLYQVKTTGGF